MITAVLLQLSNTPWFYPVTIMVFAVVCGVSLVHTFVEQEGGVYRNSIVNSN